MIRHKATGRTDVRRLYSEFGTVPGLLKIIPLLSRGEGERPVAIIAQTIMAVLMAVYVGMCVKSFIDGRKRRANA